jgi:hypothetical protein
VAPAFFQRFKKCAKSQATVLQKTVMAFPAENNMVQHGNAEGFPGLFKLFGKGFVFFARGEVA